MIKSKSLKFFIGFMLLFTSLYTGCGSDNSNKKSNVKDLTSHKITERAISENGLWNKDVCILSTYDRKDENDHKFALSIAFNKNIPSDIKHFQIYLNIDNNNDTGLNIDGSGVDYMIEDGILFKSMSKKGWEWKKIVKVNYKEYEENNKFKIKISDNSSEFIAITDINNIKNVYVSIRFFDKNWKKKYNLVNARNIYIDVLSDDDKIPFGDGSFGVFERVAIFPTIKSENGEIDYNATYAKTKQMALKFAKYVTSHEKTSLVNYELHRWTVCGVEENDASDAALKRNILQIPTKNSINPSFPYSKTNTKKVQVIELSNSAYPEALVEKKTDENMLSNFMNRSTVFPFEVSIYNDDKAIYVDILNPEAMFGLFFVDAFDSEYYKNDFEFREKFLKLPGQAKHEMISMIHETFDSPEHETSIKMGPVFSSMHKLKASSVALESNQYIYFESDTIQTTEDAKEIAQKIIDTMTIHGSKNAGHQEDPLFNILPSVIQKINPKWVSARHKPFKGINGSWIVEACSPVYAKQALATGEYHATSLPCEIAVYVDPKDNKKIVASILRPAFMFKNLFADSMIGMTVEQKKAFKVVVDNIQLDLKTIVDYTMQHNVNGFKELFETTLIDALDSNDMIKSPF